MATRIKLRRDTAANWLAQNPILAQGETGFETDTRTMKLGDGATRWVDLKYAVTGDLKVTNDTIHGDTSVSLSSGIGNRENWLLLTNANDGASSVDAYVDGVAYDSLGNTFSMGWYDGAPGGSGCYLQKTSPSGEVLFNTVYNEYQSYGYGMGVDKDDDVVMILSEGDASSNDLILVKVSGTDGTIVWQKYLNSYGDYSDYASCLDIDAQGNIFITGNSNAAGPDNNDLAYVAKFNGANGSLIWSKSYDIQAFDSSGTGLKVDKDGNVAVIGSVTWSYGFTAIYKLNGVDGSVLWQGKIKNIKYDNGNNPLIDGIEHGEIQGSDITTDTQGNFYLTVNSYFPYYPGVTAVVAKFNGSTGATMWARQLDWDDYRNSVGSVVCDELDNVYVSSTLTKYKNNYDLDNSSNRTTQNIMKINATGSVVWQRWLSSEQAETFDAKYSFYHNAFGQSIAVRGNYVLVGGSYVVQGAYNEDNQYWNAQPYIAQLNRDGGEFDINGWKFVDSSKDITTVFITLIKDDNNWTYDPASVNDFNFTVTNGNVTGTEGNTDTTDLVYVNKSNVNKVTFEGKALTLPAGGSLDVSREKLGYFSSIGKFDGPEGWNTNGAVWLNGSDRDEKGSTYSAGGWYSYNNWNDWDNYVRVPLVFKTDSEGKLIWSAGNALDQNYSSPDLVDVVYHQPTNTVISLGNDGELDGHEGFNISYLDADTGSMKQAITHIRPADGSNDIYPTSLSITSNGSPVVSGYITGARTTYANVTANAASLTGSTDSGTLVVLKSNFTVDAVTEYPKEDGTWYLYPNGDQIVSVNRYGHDEAYPTITYTGTLGSGATVDITIAGANITAAAINAGGSGYKPGQKLLVSGTVLGGASPDNDVTVYVDTVGESGAITALADSYGTGILIDGTYTGVATTAVAGSGLEGWVQYSPEGTTYTLFNRNNNGNYYGVGDTFKILGNVLGGATPANDLDITVTAINGTGHGNGQITDVTLAGTPQSANIKLYGGSQDYTITSVYNIVHELANDGFIWTPTWSKVFGSNISNVYDDFHGMTIDSNDNVIVSGYSDNTGLNSGTTWYGSYNQTGIITKFSSTGTLAWTKSIDGSEGSSTVWGVSTDADDNIYSVMVSQAANSDPYITKLTPAGEFVWQQSIAVDNSNAWAIDVADNGDVMIVGECYRNDWFSNNRHNGNWNLLVSKFDKDGNTVFSRIIWSQNGVRMNDNDDYSNQLTIKGDRFSISTYSNDPGNYNNCGLVIDLPLDGTGTGEYGDFYYEEIEINRNSRFETNSAGGHDIVTDISGVIVPRAYTFVDAPYTDGDAWRNVTIYADRDAKVQTIYKPEGGEVKGVAKITFEDGSVQTSSAQGLPQVSRPQVNGGANDYWLRPEDNGKHILQEHNQTVIIPDRNRVDLPIGFAFTVINKGSQSGVWSENSNETIYLSGGDSDNSYSYGIPAWSMATVVKIDDGTWMIAGTGLTPNWY